MSESSSRFYHVLKDRSWPRKRHTGLTTAFELEVRGWKVGVEVHGFPDIDEPHRDKFIVTVTGGTQQPGFRQIIATVIGDDDGHIEINQENDTQL